jgi:hypothetical protein
VVAHVVRQPATPDLAVVAHVVRQPAPPPQQETGWILSGLYIMALPMTITFRIMLAPAIWMFRSRSGQ